MVSRLVAARAALLARSPTALEEPGPGIPRSILRRRRRALGGRDYVLDEAWQAGFRAEGLEALLFGPSGSEVCRDIVEQNRLFLAHLLSLKGSASRLILCDTGLYGSTQRLLAAGFPDLSFESVLFARSNYKGYSEHHFGAVTDFSSNETAITP